MALDKCLDAQLWHACAGGMVKIPAVGSKVYYFPEGHAEHAGGEVEFGAKSKIPALILCRVNFVKFMADRDDDEVFVKMGLVPVRADGGGFGKECGRMLDDGAGEKPASFAKTLTQSDANNGGGFSIPRYCAETIFPKLDYSADPPVQTVLVKDVHGEIWKFRHIYRGTPRRHLLTTGWSNFVNQKKLVAGDSVVFLRAENGDLCVGIRRAKKMGDCVVGFPHSWSQFGSCIAPARGYCGGVTSSGGDTRMKGRVSAVSVVEAAKRAVCDESFEVVYYPRAGTPEFCVSASTVVDAMGIGWGAGMRFKMAFETEDSSRISWFMGTIAGTRVLDPARWPNSPWRILQVAWDEPDLLQDSKGVNPWLVELVHTIFSPPSKRLCLAQQTECLSNEQVLMQSSYQPEYAPAGIEGARQAQYDVPSINLQCNKMQLSLFPAGIQTADCEHPTTAMTIGSSNKRKAPYFMLFGQRILTEKQPSAGFSADTVSTMVNSSSDGNTDKSSNSSDGSGSGVHRHGLPDGNISIRDSHSKLHTGLRDIFGIERPGVVALSRTYQD